MSCDEMAVYEHQGEGGYKCEFLGVVNEDFYCRKCALLARKLTVVSCCGESYCQACISDILQQTKPCLVCGQEIFSTQQQIKYQKQIRMLQVNCTMRYRGCDWSGTLENLDNHLDPDQDICQFMDTICPLKCSLTIPRNKLEQHMAEDCNKREYGCQHCSFKDAYEVVVNTHWPECVYFPLQCPNFCGVTFERGIMADHMTMCRLQEVACVFTDVGCDGTFIREDQEEHTRQNIQQHLTITAAATVKINQMLQKQKQSFESNFQEQEQKFEKKFQEQKQRFEKYFQEQEQKFKKKFQELEQKSQEQKQKFEIKCQNQKKEFQEESSKIFLQQELMFRELLQQKLDENDLALKKLTDFILKRTFSMDNFSQKKAVNEKHSWKSPAMYTHMYGYKFCIGIYANGKGLEIGKGLCVNLCAMQGEHDHQLMWPAKASFTLELLHQHNGENLKYNITNKRWRKPNECSTEIEKFGRTIFNGDFVFLRHYQLNQYLDNDNDALHFCVSNVVL